MLIGDEIPLRYVPQSRYFQPQELNVVGYLLEPEARERLNTQGRIQIRRAIDPDCESIQVEYE